MENFMLEPSSINLVIYHANCNDGFGAAYSAWKLLGNRAEYIACSHGETPPNVKGKNVAICDFSFKNDVTKKLIEEADALVILDHHKSAMVELHDIPDAIFNMEKRGDFPRRIVLTSRNVAWDLAEVEKWIESRKESEDQPIRPGIPINVSR